jgi:hypothetical protein
LPSAARTTPVHLPGLAKNAAPRHRRQLIKPPGRYVQYAANERTSDIQYRDFYANYIIKQMEIITIQELRKNTDVYIDLYGKCKEFSKSCYYFENPRNKDAKKILEDWIFFRAVNYCFEHTLIIELCKLIQKNHNTQKYNINKFVSTLVKNHNLLEYKDKLSILTVNKWSDKLNSEETIKRIKYIVNLRDKHFAHIEDVDSYFSQTIKIDFSQIDYLLSLIETILIDIYSEVYECDLFLDSNIIRFESIIEVVLQRNMYLKKNWQSK